MATANVQAHYNKYNRNEGSWWAPYGGAELFAGNLSDGSNDYTTVLGFNISAYAGYTIDSIKLYLYRYDDGQSVSKTWTYQVGSAVNSDGTVTHVANTGGSFAYSAKNAWKAVTLSAAAVNALKAGNSFLHLWGANGQYAGIRPLEYGGGAYAPYLLIDYSPYPDPTPPTLAAISTVTLQDKTFTWSPGSDVIFPANQLLYKLQVSDDGGASWKEAIYTSLPGAAQISVDMKQCLGLAERQYYYKTNVKIKVWTVTPSYQGQPYPSAPVVSPAFTVNYRIVPSAPSSLTPSKTAAYEGERITFSIGRPDIYHTHAQSGAVEGIRYYVQLADGTALADVDTNVSYPSATTAEYTVGNLTSGLANRGTTIRAYAKTHAAVGEELSGPFFSGVDFTILRFRNPVIAITNVARAKETATVSFTITDTGYGGGQSNGLIANLQYKAVPVGGEDPGYTIVPRSSVEWIEEGLSGTITFPLEEAKKYTFYLLATNNETESGLSGKSSAVQQASILEYTPSFFVWRNGTSSGNQATTGASAQALIVGDDFGVAVDKGCTVVKNNADIGGNLSVAGSMKKNGKEVKTDYVSATKRVLGRSSAGAGAIEEITMSGADNVVVTGTPGSTGMLAMWNVDGDLVSASLTSQAPVKCVDRQNNLSNGAVSNQMIKIGWGYLAGNDSATTPISETVSLNGAFEDIPVVLVSAIGARAVSSGAPTTPVFGSAGNNVMEVWNVSSAGFTIRIMPVLGYQLSSSHYFGYSWIAIGTKAVT